MEAALAAIIFAIAAAGIFSTVAVMRQPGAESEDRIGAAYFGQQVLENLRAKVDQGTWDTGELDPNRTHTVTSGIYTATYNVTTESSGAKKVTLQVTWPDSP